MAAEVTAEALLQQLAEQAEKIALLITQNSEQAAQIKLLVEKNARLKKRIKSNSSGRLNATVAPHSREQPKADPKPPGCRAGQGTFSFQHAPARDTVTHVTRKPPEVPGRSQHPTNE